MPLHVQRQMVGAREGTVAQVALEWPVAGVLAVVAGELVRARELPAAAVPVAMVGLLACREGKAAGLSFPPQTLSTHTHPGASILPLTRPSKRSSLPFEPLGVLGTCTPIADLLILAPGDPKHALTLPGF